jgi:hypothetical protein
VSALFVTEISARVSDAATRRVSFLFLFRKKTLFFFAATLFVD